MGKKAVLITFRVKTERFESRGERNKIYNSLYGWKQIIRRESKRYTYRRDGILDEIPSMRVDRSMFIIMRQHMDKMRTFLEDWGDKVMWKKFDVLLDEEQNKMLRRDLDG